MEIYRNLTEEQRAKVGTEEYRSYFASVDTGQKGGSYDVLSGDELESLVHTMSDMEHSLKEYGTELMQITAEKERISTELTLATQIQGAMLPHIFPPYPDRHEFDIFAVMEPAREVGGMEGICYKEYELQLAPGDRLFLYTDGVPEATNAENEMFGIDNMLGALNQDADADPETLLHHVRESVRGFVKDAEQFDDLTMLCIDYHGT